ncbi:YcxB family protein [Peptacetobacter sp.]|uniref:YcxB family protein n=1 Tax=Peptacetobacter sp. TaxID=2991975 RepID=UPI00261B9CD1|nr:YcxB family protein [Peptacetobacter sp.]
MTIRTRNEITEKDMIEVMKFGIPKIYSIMSIGFGILGISMGIYGVSNGKVFTGIASIALAIGIVFWRYYYLPRKMGKMQYRGKKESQNGRGMVQNVNFFNNHAEMITSDSKMIKLKYSDMQMLKEMKDKLIIIFGKNVIMLIKKDGFKEGNIDDLKNLLVPIIEKNNSKKA